ncbi:MAG: DUF3783 domain-containing protein [Firmicutes bacterium]|nr:DUF3783 domain-containing protein [Bacillota bacterium]
MEEIKKKRWISVLLTIAMILSICNMPVYGYGASEEVVIENSIITPETTSITISLSHVPALGILKVVALDAEEAYDSNKLNEYETLYFGAFYNGTFQVGENQLTLNASPQVGKKIVAVVRDSSGTTMQDYASNGVVVTTSSVEESKTPEEILKNCSVRLTKGGVERTEAFQETDTSTDVSVHLDDTVESCNLTLFAYAGNTAFDADSTQNIRLWSGKVTNGAMENCSFAVDKLPLKVGYKVIACLNVPVGTDTDGDTFYRSVTSQALEIVDEKGQSFEDYNPYPDVFIDENQLEEGAEKIHISIVGDERLFQGARDGKISITCAVAQYPEGETFDFENEKQISLASNISVTEAFSGKEISLSEPLRAGYRVRAVVYWSQSTELFLPKGNDYEEVFHRPDDSLLVKECIAPAVTIEEPVNVAAKAIRVEVKGNLPEGATLLLKSYDSKTQQFAISEGTWVGSAFNVTSGTYTLTPQSGSLTKDKKIVAFILDQGATVVQSQPVSIAAVKAFTILPNISVTAGATQLSFQVTSIDEAITNLNIVRLCSVKANGEADLDHALAVKYGQKPGEITFELSEEALRAGDKVCLSLTYMDGSEIVTYTSEGFAVVGALGENSLSIVETEVDTNMDSVTVMVNGCEIYKGGLLILTTGPADNVNDADSRSRLASVPFTGAGTYQLSFNSKQLRAGQTILPHLYFYDSEQDATQYQYGAPVIIKNGSGQVVEPKVEIATDTIREDRTDLWVVTEFSAGLTGVLKLYTYAGDIFDMDTAMEIYSGAATSNENSQRVTFGGGKLTAEKNLIAVLELSDGFSLQSNVKAITAMPEKEKPVAQILDSRITEGDTYLKASVTFDSSVSQGSYVLYQFTGEELNPATATKLSSGNLYRSETSKSIYLGTGKLEIGANLQLVLTADDMETKSNVVIVEPSPDWGTPYAAFDVTAVKADDKTIPVTVDYSAEYLSLGDDFYCDVSIYSFPAKYTDKEFEEKELWETYGIATRVGQVNSTSGQETKGTIRVPVNSYATLNPDDRLIIKLRLPHTEWDGEEVDYISASVPIIGAEEEVPSYHVVLYNLDDTSSRGHRLRQILDELGIPAVTMENKNLNQTIGYLAGIAGYEAAEQGYNGSSYSSEFMLMCNLPESLLDRFLDEMIANGLRIDHKAVVTEYNRDYEFCQLIGDIESEHDTFQGLIALNKLVEQAEKLTETDYGSSPHWETFQEILAKADGLLRSEEPPLEKLQRAYGELKSQYLLVTEMEEITGIPVITIKQETDGTYTLTAQMKDGTEAEHCQFTWSNGQTGISITGIGEKDLIGTTLTVTGNGFFGTLTAQLAVPDAPQVEASAQEKAMTLQWNVPVEADNQPAPTSYLLQIYQGEELIKTVEVDEIVAGENKNVTIGQLKEGVAYNVRIYANSPVGRSDATFLSVTTKTEQGSSVIVTPGTVIPGGDDNPVDIDDPQTPLDKKPQGTSDQQESAVNQTAIEVQTSATVPGTGDEEILFFWMLLLVGSLMSLAVLMVEKRRS